MTYPPAGREGEVEAWLSRAKALLEADGLAVLHVSTGGTPGIWRAGEVPVATEYRIGTYVYNDRSLVAAKVCEWADCALADVAKVGVWLDDPRDFWTFNKVCASYFPGGGPARSTVHSQIIIDAKVEIDAIAYKPMI